MTTDSDFAGLGSLLTNLQRPAKPEWHYSGKRQKKHTHVEQPDALVLSMVRTTCACCKSIVEYPSSHLLMRYGQNKWKWSGLTVETAPANLPLEIKYTDVSNAHCMKCFPLAPFSPTSAVTWKHGLRLNCEELQGAD